MTCEELSERMPAVAAGTAAWSAEEAEHLRGCAACRAEWVVVSAGALVAHDQSVDADALAGRVLDRLRAEPSKALRLRARWLVGLAAAAAGLLAVLLPRGPAAPSSSGPAARPLAVDVPGLDGLGAESLADLLESLDTPWTETSTSDAPSLDDLDVQELERVERSWEI